MLKILFKSNGLAVFVELGTALFVLSVKTLAFAELNRKEDDWVSSIVMIDFLYLTKLMWYWGVSFDILVSGFREMSHGGIYESF